MHNFRKESRRIESVLIVEDNKSYSSILGEQIESILGRLSKEPVSISYAETVKEARSVTSNWVPDVIFLDFELPDGFASELLPCFTALRLFVPCP